MISIKLTGQFLVLTPAHSEKGLFAMEYEVDLTLLALLTRLGVEGAGVNYNVLVNNSRKSADYIVQDNDSIIVMPLLAGG